MDPAVRNLIADLHQRSPAYVLALTGGGVGLASWLLAVPGGSRSVLEVVVPYSQQALSEFLGHHPASFCSSETARLMAQRAHARAGWLAPGSRVAGVACTASLRSDRPKRGDHRFHLAVKTSQTTAAYSLTLLKEARDRVGEEEVLDRVLLNAMAEVSGCPQRVETRLLPGEQVEAETHGAEDPLVALFEGRVSALYVNCDGRIRSDGPKPRILLPGSFNPLHEGHCALHATAARRLEAAAAFEMTIVNADKPPLAYEEVRQRLAQFAWRSPVWLTGAPTFIDKARLFPGAVFVVGFDTAVRILQPRFYGDSEAALAESLAQVRAHGCRFLVAGRVDPEGRFHSLEDLHVPEAFQDLFAAIPADEFRRDVSSTWLRAVAGDRCVL
jgi:nicotinamide mononucleotide (NMN) deamidase PncC